MSDSDSSAAVSPKKQKKYLQKYCDSWESDDDFKVWLRKSEKGENFAFCSACQVDLTLNAGVQDLRRHAKRKKHINFMVQDQLQGAVEHVELLSLWDNDDLKKEQSSSKEVCKEEQEQSSTSKKCYIRKFRESWLDDERFSSWVRKSIHDQNKAFCTACNIEISGGVTQLSRHSLTSKHRKKLGLPFQMVVADTDEHSPLEGLTRTVLKRNRKQLDKHRISGSQEHAIGAATSSSQLKPANIGFIGCGNMAQALLTGFIKNGLIETANTIVSAPSDKNLVKLHPLGIRTTHDNLDVLKESDIIFLCIKPNIVPEVLAGFDPMERDRSPLFVSVASGLTITHLEDMLTHIMPNPRVIRVMPNTPCMVAQGCCVYASGSNVEAAEGNVVKCLLGSVGLCEEVNESQMDAACGLAGSGPAYIYAVIEAMADGGVKMGLPRALALAMAAQTVKGAAMMVLETAKHPGQLKDDVCSPGGTTITAMHTLEKSSLRGAIMTAVEASAIRSKELG